MPEIAPEDDPDRARKDWDDLHDAVDRLQRSYKRDGDGEAAATRALLAGDPDDPYHYDGS